MTLEKPTTPGPEVQLELSLVRTSLALDRTLLAWIRTSLTFITFGFTLAKFVGAMAKNDVFHVAQAMGTASPKALGLIMMGLGLIGLLGGAYDYWRTIKQLSTRSQVISPVSTSFLIAAALAVLTMVLMLILTLE